MTPIMIDASAWIELIEGTELGRRVQKYLDDCDCLTSSLTVAEVCSKARRKGNYEEAAFQSMTTTDIIPLTGEIAKTAGMLHAYHHEKNSKFSMGDAVILATARKLGAKILTKDTDFRNIPEAILLK